MAATLPLRVLWIDDDLELIADLAGYFATLGFAIDCVGDLRSADAQLAQHRYDLTIVDLSLPDGSGLAMIRGVDRRRCGEIVVMTGHGSVKTAVESLRHQVFDYLMKPVELSELRNTLERVRKQRDTASEAAGASAERVDVPAQSAAGFDIRELLIGESPAMQRTQALVQRAAQSDISVLIQGESGTGKEVVARSLHQLSPRRSAPFVALNCGAVSPSLIASELFGHEKGAFTGAIKQHQGIFERAAGGTLFLDEVTEMPIDLQATLLRVLETGTVLRVGGSEEISVDVRLVAATNRDPMQYVETGRFRLDLYYRLQVFPITLPPLKDRGRDVLLLADYFLQRRKAAVTPAGSQLGAAAQAALLAHDWPGNVRELRNVMERAELLAGTGMIQPEHLMLAPPRPAAGATVPVVVASPPISAGVGNTGRVLRGQEQALIEATLQACGGNRTRAAAQLGISVKTLYNKLKRYADAPVGKG